jgi:hypothetical protein
VETDFKVGNERFIVVYSEVEPLIFSCPLNKVVQFVTGCFLCGVVSGTLRADGRSHGRAVLRACFAELKDSLVLSWT